MFSWTPFCFGIFQPFCLLNPDQDDTAYLPTWVSLLFVFDLLIDTLLVVLGVHNQSSAKPPEHILYVFTSTLLLLLLILSAGGAGSTGPPGLTPIHLVKPDVPAQIRGFHSQTCQETRTCDQTHLHLYLINLSTWRRGMSTDSVILLYSTTSKELSTRKMSKC